MDVSNEVYTYITVDQKDGRALHDELEALFQKAMLTGPDEVQAGFPLLNQIYNTLPRPL